MSDFHLRQLPSVSSLLQLPAIHSLIGQRGHDAVVSAVRTVLDALRKAIRDGDLSGTSSSDIESKIREVLACRRSPRPVLNATGILLHTGLGRAPLARKVVEAVAEVAGGYCDLEFDLETGRRGARASAISGLIQRLTGAEAATVVNNNAAATILALRATAKDREVIVSRGQLVEIGGSFRLPEIFEVSGAKLREVGTTNRTRLADYAKAINAETAAILRVHTGNYRIIGFTESVEIRDLAGLGRERGLVTIDDIGSGALDAKRPPLISDEPNAAASLAAGADLVLFSGDKLMGGPQCGILAGRADLIRQIASDPLFRAVRVDKMTLAALDATLNLILDGDPASTEIPLWNFLTTPLPSLRTRADAIAKRLSEEGGFVAEVCDSTALLGAGSLPTEEIPSVAVRLAPPWPVGVDSEVALARALRLGDLPVVARVQSGDVWLDLKAIEARDDARLADAVLQAVAGSRGPTLS